MNGLFTTIANFAIGTMAKLPTHNVQVDTQALADFAPIINYFIPFYLIAPVISVWLGFMGVTMAIMAIWGFIKRNF